MYFLGCLIIHHIQKFYEKLLFLKKSPGKAITKSGFSLFFFEKWVRFWSVFHLFGSGKLIGGTVLPLNYHHLSALLVDQPIEELPPKPQHLSAKPAHIPGEDLPLSITTIFQPSQLKNFPLTSPMSHSNLVPTHMKDLPSTTNISQPRMINKHVRDISLISTNSQCSLLTNQMKDFTSSCTSSQHSFIITTSDPFTAPGKCIK